MRILRSATLGSLFFGTLVASASLAAWGPELIAIEGQFQAYKGDRPEADSFQVTAVCSDDKLSIGGCCLFDEDPTQCGNGGPDEVFTAGDTPALSTYWNEVVDCSAYDCSNYQAIWSLAIVPGNLTFLFQNEPVDFGDLSDRDGQNVSFCVQSGLTLPAPADGLLLQWGFGVETPIDPFQVGTTSVLDVTGAGACTPYEQP